LNEWETVEDFDAKIFKWVKNLSCHDILMLLGQNVPSGMEYITTFRPAAI
jgi:hypothetical protein